MRLMADGDDRLLDRNVGIAPGDVVKLSASRL